MKNKGERERKMKKWSEKRVRGLNRTITDKTTYYLTIIYSFLGFSLHLRLEFMEALFMAFFVKKGFLQCLFLFFRFLKFLFLI